MIGESPKRAPVVVVVLGCLWLASAVGNLAAAVGLVVLFGVIRNFAPGGTDPLPPPPPVAKPLYWAFQHYVLAGSLQGALALLGIYSGSQFLRLKRWARTFLEAGGWAAIALSVVIGIWRSQFWMTPGPNAAIRLFAGLLVAAYFSVFPAAFVWLLRSRWVVPAFVPGAQQPSRVA